MSVEISSNQETAVTNVLQDELINNFKTYISILNAKSDTSIKIFNGNKKVILEDIYQLNERVQDKIKNHRGHYNKATIHFSFEDGGFRLFDNWVEFERANWITSSKLKSCTINWDFYLMIEGYELPQRHSLQVRIGSELRPDEFMRMWFQNTNDHEVESALADVVARVDFINKIISDELLFLVGDWYGGLHKNIEQSKLTSFFTKSHKYIRAVIRVLMPTSALFLFYLFVSLQLNSIINIGYSQGKTISTAILFLIFAIVIFMVFNEIGNYLSSAVKNKVDNYERHSPISLTNGDKVRDEEIANRNNKLSSSIIWRILSSTLLSFVSALFKWIFHVV